MFEMKEVRIRVGLMMFSSTETPILKRDLIEKVLEYEKTLDHGEVSQELRRLIEKGHYVVVDGGYILRRIVEHAASDRIYFLNN